MHEEDTTSQAGFAALDLAPAVLSAIERIGYEQPTPIQAESIPPLLAGRDLIGMAQTGTGKTAAFALPLLSCVDLSLAKPQMRATASALLLLVMNLIGLGFGPSAVGIMNDALAPRFGDEAVRYSLLLIGVTSLWGCAHNWVAARHLRRDLDAKAA